MSCDRQQSRGGVPFAIAQLWNTKGGVAMHGDFSDARAFQLVEELGVRLHDEIATFLTDHPEVPPALVGLRVGQVFLIHFQLRYGDDFAKAARDMFDLILKDAEKPSRCDS
jgi:hypothetical protein